MTYEERMRLASTEDLSPEERKQWRREMMQRIMTQPDKLADLLVMLMHLSMQTPPDHLFDGVLHSRATKPPVHTVVTDVTMKNVPKSERYQQILKDNRLPGCPEEVLDMRWVARDDDWWHQTAKGWFWFDKKSYEWKHSAMGPP